MLIEQGVVPVSALPMADFSAHLRLGTGFSSDGLVDGLLESYLRAAIAAVEGRIGKALIHRRFLWQEPVWRNGGAGQALPMAPVSAVAEVALVDGSGAKTVLDSSRWRLQPDLHRPKLEPVFGLFPAIPQGGHAEVAFDAGFGSQWSAIPADLAQAVLLLAAEFYELRHDAGEVTAGLPRRVQALIERWRTVRVLGGGGA